MRKLMLLTVAFAVVLGSSSVQAWPEYFVYEPSPNDLWDLSHNSAFTWGIDLAPTSQYAITEASLTFHNIYNWTEEPNWLHIRLLDNPALGVTEYTDKDFTSNDFFEGMGTHLVTWTDDPGGGPGMDVTFTFSAEWLQLLNDYAYDGRVGFALDPDCHFYNDGISFSVAQAVPEPLTVCLFGVGLVGVGLVRRRSNR